MALEFKSSDGKKEIVDSRFVKWAFAGFLVLLGNAGYLAAAASPSWFYYANVLLHILLGLFLIYPLFTKVRYFLKTDAEHGKTFGTAMGKMGYLLIRIAFATGIYLLLASNSGRNGMAFPVHVWSGFIAFMMLISCIRRAAYNISVENTYWRAGRWGLTVFIVAGMLPIVSMVFSPAIRNLGNVIENPQRLPENLQQAATDGPDGAFYPSPATTAGGQPLYLNDRQGSVSCSGSGCHDEIVAQLEKSQHLRTVRNTEIYERTLAYTTAKLGTKGPKYCQGCHEPRVLLSGGASPSGTTMRRPAGAEGDFSCTVCHGIQTVPSTLGNGAYVVADPPLAWLARSGVPMLEKLRNFLIVTDPEPHRRTFLKPFHKNQTSEFCAACHKMTVDAPLGQEPAVPGLISYDFWAGSSFARSDVKSFYAVQSPRACVDCHMARVPSNDPAADGGWVHDHSFPAVASVSTGAGVKQALLDSAMLSVRIFGRRLAEPSAAGGETPAFASLPGMPARTLKRAYPDRFVVPVQESRLGLAGRSPIQLDVLVRVRDTGHAFPAGSPGLSHALLEMIAVDASGKTIFRTAAPDLNGVSSRASRLYGAVFQRDSSVTATLPHAIGATGVRYWRYLPPASVDLTTFALELPPDIHGKISLIATLKHQTNTALAAGGAAGNYSFSLQHPSASDDLNVAQKFTVSSDGWRILGADTVAIVLQPDGAGYVGSAQMHPGDPALWNEYGIGLLRNREYSRALAAFRRGLEIDPGSAELLINEARVHLLRNDPVAAEKALDAVLSRERKNPKALYFRALALKLTGRLAEAKEILKKLRKQFPEDRGVMNELGHVYLLLKSYKAASTIFLRVTQFAPDDPVAHYYQIEAYRKQNFMRRAAREERLYKRFARQFDSRPVIPAASSSEKLRAWQVLPWSHYTGTVP